MGKKIDRTAEIRNRFLSMGISAEVVERISAYNVIAADGSVFSEVIEMGYPVIKKGVERRKLTCISGTGETGLERGFQDQEWVATFLDRNMRVTPLHKRLALPAWVEAKSKAKQHEELMALAKGLTRSVAQGQVVKAEYAKNEENKMTEQDALPWDDNNGTSVIDANPGNMHATATQLARAAMESAAQRLITGMTDYQFAQADYDRRLAEMRAENAKRHAANNNGLTTTAAQRKADRQAAHQARNQAAAAAAAARKLAKAV